MPKESSFAFYFILSGKVARIENSFENLNHLKKLFIYNKK